MEINMRIRQMSEEDITEVGVIEEETFSEPWSKEDFRSAIMDGNNCYLVVELEGRIAGYCGFWGIAGEGDIFNVAVKKELRGQKIGYLMMTELIKEASCRGITSLTLEVRSSNTAAIHLYESLGFQREGVRRDFYSKPKEDAVIMWLKLIQ